MRPLVCFLFAATLAPSQTITPFTLTQVSHQFDKAGKAISESRLLIASLENGSTVSVDLGASGRGVRQIIDTARQRTILMNPSSRSVSEMPYKWSPASPPCEQRLFPIIGATVLVDRFPSIIDGVSVQSITMGLRDGGFVENLIAPSLGCRVLRSTTWRKGRVVATLVAEHLKIGNPDQKLFEVPSGYRLVRMSIR
jgi:hypothetical protein